MKSMNACRRFGGKRWTTSEDERLLDLVRHEHDWNSIATEMKRTFSGVQNRFRLLKAKDAAFTKSPPALTRSQDAKLEPNFTCGALSLAGDKVVQAVYRELRYQGALSSRKLVASGATRLALAAIIRETMLSRLNTDAGWLRITFGRIRAREHGVARNSLRNLLIGLGKCGFLERGYLGAIKLDVPQGSPGALVFIRATSLLADVCERQGISRANLFTHFPALA